MSQNQMMNNVRYRYFLAFLLDLVLRRELMRLCDAAGQLDRRVKAEHLHLTLCVIAELAHRDCFIASRVDATLANQLPPSCKIHLGRVLAGRHGAAIYTLNSQEEIQAFYSALLSLLAQQQIFPLHRKSGLRPHVTLGYHPSAFECFKVPMEWVPGELVLIESEVGRGVHNVLRRWPLQPPPQYSLPFDELGFHLPSSASLRIAVG